MQWCLTIRLSSLVLFISLSSLLLSPIPPSPDHYVVRLFTVSFITWLTGTKLLTNPLRLHRLTPLTHEFTNSFTRSPTRALTHIQSLTQPPTHPFTHSLTSSPTHPLTHFYIHFNSCSRSVGVIHSLRFPIFSFCPFLSPIIVLGLSACFTTFEIE